MRLPRALGAVAAAFVLALAGCSSSGSPDGTGFNDADVDFATDMIQHHAQALQMVDLTLGRDLDPRAVRLAEDIRSAQAPEIEQMADWLDERDREVPETSRDHANAHGEGFEADADMPGMLSGDQMTALESAGGATFQDLWLEMMVEHHEGAVTMAETVVEDGENAEVRALAEDVIDTQRAEIETMKELLGS